jgi:hypothetical protein
MNSNVFKKELFRNEWEIEINFIFKYIRDNLNYSIKIKLLNFWKKRREREREFNRH